MMTLGERLGIDIDMEAILSERVWAMPSAVRGFCTFWSTQAQAPASRNTGSGIATALRMPSSFAMAARFQKMRKEAQQYVSGKQRAERI